MGDIEKNTCDFCKQIKQVNRTYIKPSKYIKPSEEYNKLHNEGDYFIIINTCNDCGEPSKDLSKEEIQRIEEIFKQRCINNEVKFRSKKFYELQVEYFSGVMAALNIQSPSWVLLMTCGREIVKY